MRNSGKVSERSSISTSDLLFCIVALIIFQKLDGAATAEYLPGGSTMVKIFLGALIMLILCKHILCPFPFRKGKGVYLEMDSRGTWTLFSVLVMIFCFKQPLDSKQQ